MRAFYEKKEQQIYTWRGKGMNFMPHLHKEAELVLCTVGNMEVLAGNQWYTIEAGDLIVLQPNQIHAYHSPSEAEFLLCIVHPDFVSHFKRYFKKYLPEPVLHHDCVKEIEIYFRQLVTEMEIGTKAEFLVPYLYMVLGLAFRNMEIQEGKQVNCENNLQEILFYLEEHYKEPVTLAEIAAAVGLNLSYVSRLFSEKLHCTITSYIHDLRITYAKELLHTGEMNMTQIAFECGFSSLRSFDRVFRKSEGCTPLAFRKSSLKTH